MEGEREPGCTNILVWAVGVFSLFLMVAWHLAR